MPCIQGCRWRVDNSAGRRRQPVCIVPLMGCRLCFALSSGHHPYRSPTWEWFRALVERRKLHGLPLSFGNAPLPAPGSLGCSDFPAQSLPAPAQQQPAPAHAAQAKGSQTGKAPWIASHDWLGSSD